MLYRSTDRLCRRAPPMNNLAHSASFESLDKNAPSKSGTKHLVEREIDQRGVVLEDRFDLSELQNLAPRRSNDAAFGRIPDRRQLGP
jgi:hypothetical protein